MRVESLSERHSNHSVFCCVHELFEQQVAKTPDVIAIKFGEHSLSYDELNRRANRLAHYIRRHHHHDGEKISPVGICLERSIDAIVAVIGVLKAGAAYVPIDLSYPIERQSYILTDSNVSVVISRGDIELSFPETIARIDLAQYDFSDSNNKENTNSDSCDIENLAVACSPQDLAYLIYTSGSTGKPKGVCMPHQSLVNMLAWQIHQQGDYFGKKTLQFSPLSFDVSFQEIFSTLSSGGELVLISNHLRLDQLALVTFIAEQQIERIFLPYVALNGLAMAAIAQECYPESLIDVITAGEQLVITTAIRQFFQALPHCHLHNHYGPSEAHVVTAYTLEGKAEEWPVLPPIGAPIDNIEIYLLDTNNCVIKDETPGELCIAGAQLAEGYHQRPEETAAKFVNIAVNSMPSKRMYRTGDLAKWRKDGLLDILGRMDFQVKVRGYRVELGEVEVLLMKHPAVRDAVVLIQTAREQSESSEDNRLIAFVIISERALQHHSQSSVKESIQQFMKKVAPDYMRPAAIVIVNHFPLSASGKLDRKAFPVIAIGKLKQQDAALAKEGIEKTLAEIWSELFGVKKVSRHAQFFNLGGNSLSAIKMVQELRRRGLMVEVHMLYQHPVLSELAIHLQACNSTDIGSDGMKCPKMTASLLKDDKPSSTPFDVETYLGIDTVTAQAWWQLPENLCHQIRQQAKVHAVSVAAIFHLVWGKTVGCLVGHNDAVFGTVLSRHMFAGADTENEAEQFIHQFIHIVPMYMRLDNLPVLECLWLVQDNLAQLVKHQKVSQALTLQSLQQQLSQLSGTAPLFTSLLNYYHSEIRSIFPAEPLLAVTPSGDVGPFSRACIVKHPIYISIEDIGKDFAIHIQAEQGVNLERVSDIFQMILQKIVTALDSAPEKKIDRINPITGNSDHFMTHLTNNQIN
ncbi:MULTISPECIES: non-ribosomal peptide synthetase [Xenorhabdus]|uniref:non-ribosomal peptide synthetase n=1 Tax=Xenorhabdus TaxID=626 RepID=UPI0006892933|nr:MULTISPECIES: non-ribosomal peptide synthetase [Xenorhabdus]MBC8945149.1 Amino acid adenylation [Xenorhabdus indica]